MKKKARAGKTAYAVLLRGVNVGGRSSLPMAMLQELLTDLGYSNVRTYLQSGNAVLTATDGTSQVTDNIQRALRERVGRSVEVVVRSADQLGRIVKGWPFDYAAPPIAKHVTFLRQASDAAPLRTLPLRNDAPERFVVAGTEVYLFLPNGLGRSKLAALVALRLKGTAATTRNWNTVVALRDLTAAEQTLRNGLSEPLPLDGAKAGSSED